MDFLSGVIVASAIFLVAVLLLTVGMTIQDNENVRGCQRYQTLVIKGSFYNCTLRAEHP